MKKPFLCLSIILIGIICLCSCSTTKTIGSSEVYIPAMGSYEDDTISIRATTRPLDLAKPSSSSYIELTVKNKGTSLVSLDLDKSTYNFLTVGSKRLIDGESRVINSNLPQATIPIAPNGMTTRSLFVNDGLIYNVASSMYITINTEGKDVGYSIDLTPSSQSSKIIGRVSVSGSLMTDIYSNKDAEIQNALMKEAQKLYGNNVQIINIHYEMKTGALGAAAAVLSYGLLTSKSYTATADVVRWE